MKTTAIGSVLALAILMGTSAFAADKAPTSTKSAESYNETPAATKGPATKKQCKSEAHAKKLHGKQRTAFLKECEAGKPAT